MRNNPYEVVEYTFTSTHMSVVYRNGEVQIFSSRSFWDMHEYVREETNILSYTANTLVIHTVVAEYLREQTKNGVPYDPYTNSWGFVEYA
jgi:radical SAM superfamily enzyme